MDNFKLLLLDVCLSFDAEYIFLLLGVRLSGLLTLTCLLVYMPPPRAEWKFIFLFFSLPPLIVLFLMIVNWGSSNTSFNSNFPTSSTVLSITIRKTIFRQIVWSFCERLSDESLHGIPLLLAFNFVHWLGGWLLSIYHFEPERNYTSLEDGMIILCEFPWVREFLGETESKFFFFSFSSFHTNTGTQIISITLLRFYGRILTRKDARNATL